MLIKALFMVGGSLLRKISWKEKCLKNALS